jgi:YbbR domain-containing protein
VTSFAAALLFVGLAATAWATPPDSIGLSIDSTHFLTVDVHHPVKQLGTAHYINQITVALNGVNIITQNFKSQSSLEWQEAYYQLIDAKEGDKITVTATCSIFGKLSTTLIVPALSSGG